MIKLFWVECGTAGRWTNFGDWYSQVLVRAISGDEVERVDKPEDADLVAVGSLLHLVPGSYAGSIWGTGIIAEEQKMLYPWAKIYALRGKLTAQRLGIKKDIPLGDPLLLLQRPKIEPRFELGIAPHYVDFENVEIWNLARRNESVLVIDPLARDAPERIASCKNIISSSLHGLVVADAYGIPNLHVLFSDGKISGNTFKFRDYYSALGIDDPIPLRFDKQHTLKMLLGYIQDSYQVKQLDDIRRDLLQVFPFREYKYAGSCEERSQKIAEMIAAESTVLDLGCGQQMIRRYLRDCEYQPCDNQPGQNVLFCDFNWGVYPKVSKRYNYVVCAGILERVKEPATFISRVFEMGDNLLLSYAVRTEGQSVADREKNGWVNHFTIKELNYLLEGIGLEFLVRDQLENQVIGYVRQIK